MSSRRSTTRWMIAATDSGHGHGSRSLDGKRQGHDQGGHPALPERHDGHQRGLGPGLGAPGHRRDQQGGRGAGQEDRARHRGRRLGLADLRREGAEAHLHGQGRGHLRRLDVGEPQGDAAGLREEQGAAVLPPSSTRGSRPRRTSSTRARRPTSRSSRGWSSSRTSSRSRRCSSSARYYVFPRTANKEIKAWAKANGMKIVGEEYSPLGNTEYATHDQQDQGRQARRGLPDDQRRQQRRVLEAVSPTRDWTRRSCRSSRSRRLRTRSAASASRTSSASTSPGTTTRRLRAPRTRSS